MAGWDAGGELPTQKTGQMTQLGAQQDVELQELCKETRRHRAHRGIPESREWILSQISHRMQHSKTAGQGLHSEHRKPSQRPSGSSQHTPKEQRVSLPYPTSQHTKMHQFPCPYTRGPHFRKMSRRKGRPFEDIKIFFFLERLNFTERKPFKLLDWSKFNLD